MFEAAQGELEKSVGVGFTHPLISVVEPFIAIRFGLLAKPTDFIPAPDMDAIRGEVLAGVIRTAKVVEFDDVGQGLAGLSTGRAPSRAATVD